MKQLSRWYPWIKFIGLAVLIMGPLLAPGYILTIDMPWTPHLPTALVSNNWLFYVVLHSLGAIIPSMFLQKLMLLSIFILAGVGVYRLAEERTGQWPAFLAGILYAVNPFVYTRLMAGQYLILLGYALLPWFVRALVRLLERPGWRPALYLAAWGFGVATLAIHDIGLIGLLGLVIVVVWGWGRRPKVVASIKWLGAAAIAWLVLCSLWLIPLLLGRSGTAHEIAAFDWFQFDSYLTKGGQVGVPLNTLSLQGFWADNTGKYILPSATGALFWLVFAIIAALIGLGIWRSIKRRDRLGMALAIAAFIAWILAMGIAWEPVAPITRWLVNHVPLYRGYREPQKWAALMALAYAYLAAVGLGAVRDRLHGWQRDIVLIALMLPLLWVPMLLWGTGGQLRSVDYPAAWYTLNQRLNTEPGTFKVLMLPWHQYIRLDFAGRTVANPAPGFFDRPVLSSSDPEIAGVAAPRTPDNAVIEDDVLAGRFVDTDAGSKLAPLGVRYVVLLKQSDWQSYRWLDRQTDVKLVDQTNAWKLYRVEVAK